MNVNKSVSLSSLKQETEVVKKPPVEIVSTVLSTKKLPEILCNSFPMYEFSFMTVPIGISQGSPTKVALPVCAKSNLFDIMLELNVFWFRDVLAEREITLKMFETVITFPLEVIT